MYRLFQQVIDYTVTRGIEIRSHECLSRQSESIVL